MEDTIPRKGGGGNHQRTKFNSETRDIDYVQVPVPLTPFCSAESLSSK